MLGLLTRNSQLDYVDCKPPEQTEIEHLPKNNMATARGYSSPSAAFNLIENW